MQEADHNNSEFQRSEQSNDCLEDSKPSEAVNSGKTSSDTAPPVSQSRSLAMVQTRTLLGVHAEPVIVEVHLANGLPAFSTVGLPETAVKESKDRVRGAILNSGFEFPAKRITVNLSPADLPKTGSRFDLPIALGILAASGQIPVTLLHEYEFVGELALDGHLRKIAGVLPTAVASAEADKQLVVPNENAHEAAIVEKATVLAAVHLLDVCRHLAGQGELGICQNDSPISPKAKCKDLAEVRGQQQAKRALEIAAAGGHSLLLIGPPGTGKSMLASRLPGILPALTVEQALETAAIHSVSHGKLDLQTWRDRPFRSPHHSASSAALVGGGSNPKPGEISLAHNGLLFLDELTEFSRATLEQLREPLETGVINISRAAQNVQYPADFSLIAACNPCKCGYHEDGTDRCRCTATSIENYRGKLSGPLLDRIDMHVYLQRLQSNQLRGDTNNEERSQIVRSRVERCQTVQFDRQGGLNQTLKGPQLDVICGLKRGEQEFLELASERLHLSARAYHRILRVARTIADLDHEINIEQAHLAEAIGFRKLDRA